MECFKAYAFLTCLSNIYKDSPYGLDEFSCPLAFIEFLWFGKEQQYIACAVHHCFAILPFKKLFHSKSC
eukprot:4675122-Ditylum_brightwellii.AAC.1